MIESTASVALVTHMLCWTWAICFLAATSSENDQGSMNLASKTAPVPSTTPSSVAAIQRITGCRIQLWTALIELDNQVVRIVRRLRLTPLFPPKPLKGGPVVAHDDPGIRAADKGSPVAIFGV